MNGRQIPKVRTCDECGRERLTVETEDGRNVCRTDIEQVDQDARPEGYKDI